MNWRVVDIQTRGAALNMALDESICEHIKAGKSIPTIRFYRWNPSAVSIGYFQSLEDEINIEKCAEMNVDIVRRRTGGGAVYHDYAGEITYSVLGPENLFPKGITESYHDICGWIISGLKEVGIESEFKPINDIIVGGKKISGNAQTRRNGILQQHGTILYDLDVKKMFSLLKVGKEKIADKMIQAVEERVTRVLNQKQLSMDELQQALIKGFTAGKEFEFGDYSDSELKRAEELAEKKYGSREWNYLR